MYEGLAPEVIVEELPGVIAPFAPVFTVTEFVVHEISTSEAIPRSSLTNSLSPQK